MADPTPTQITQNLPSPYLTGAYTALGERLLPLLSSSAGINYGSFQGNQFVAGQNQLQQQAANLAGGLGSYQPYIDQANQYGQQAGQTLAGAQQYAGPQAYQQFMSPYQQDVINSTLANYDIQAQKGLAPLSAQAVAGGAFGGAREGIQKAAYQSQSDLNRAMTQANLLNQGFTQANQLAQNAYQQQLALAQQQQGLGTFTGQLGQTGQQLLGNQIQGLSTLGQQQQQSEQAKLSAQQQMLQNQAFEPYTRYGLVGQQLTSLSGGYPSQVQTYNPVQPVSPLQSFLGTATGLGGLAGKIFG
jgi:hypothetical protein